MALDNTRQYSFAQGIEVHERFNELIDVRFMQSQCDIVFRLVFSTCSSSKLSAIHAIDQCNLGVDLEVIGMAGLVFTSEADWPVEGNPPVIVPIFVSYATFVFSVLLYNWFVEDPAKAVQTGKNRGLKGAMLGQIALDHEYTKDGVLVKQWPGNALVLPSLTDQFLDSIGNDNADVEKFALMCFTRLKYSQRADAPPPQPGSLFLHERCYLGHSDKTTPVFLIDVCGLVTADVLKEIAARMLALKQEGKPFSSALCLANHQNGLPWQFRETDAAVSEDAVTLAKACGVTFVTTADLLLLVIGAETYGWSLDAIKDSLSQPGRQGTCPPSFRKVGIVRHYYERPQVVSVLIDPDATARIRVGDTLAIRLRDRFFQHVVASLEVNHQQVTEAGGGEIAGIKIPLHRGDVPLGVAVFCKVVQESDEAKEKKAQ
jgi:hypothetical protein